MRQPWPREGIDRIEDEKPKTSVNSVVSLTQHPESKITCMDEYEHQKVSFLLFKVAKNEQQYEIDIFTV